MVLVLDNYDSFTYNLVQYLGELGQKVEVRRNDQITPVEVEAMRPDHIVVSPGPCTPQKAGISIDLIKQVWNCGDIADIIRRQFHRDDFMRVGINT